MSVNKLAYALDEWRRVESMSDLEVIYETIARESANQDFSAMVGVACVVRNRVKHARWPSKARDVCLQRKKFSSWDFLYNGQPDKQIARSARGLKRAKLAWEVSEQACSEMRATHLYDDRLDPPSWAVNIVKIDRIWFFNDENE